MDQEQGPAVLGSKESQTTETETKEECVQGRYK